MISLAELKKLIKEQLNEIEPMDIDPILKGVDLTGLDKMDISELEMILHARKRNMGKLGRGPSVGLTPEQEQRYKLLQKKHIEAKRAMYDPDRERARERSAAGADPSVYQAKLKNVPAKPDWSDPLSGDTTVNPTVDPHGRTQAANSRERTTRVVKKLKENNKTISQSRLRQIIKEELLVLLTDEEVKEMFGVDLNKKVE